MQVFDISAWGGINKFYHPRKISPGEFQTLTNARTDKGAIKADAVDALINIPVAKQIYANLGPQGYENPWEFNNGATYNISAIAVSGITLSVGDSVGALVPFTTLSAFAGSAVTAGDPFDFSVYKDTTATAQGPGTCIGYSRYAAGVGWASRPCATAYRNTFYCSKEVLIDSSASGNTWYGFEGGVSGFTGDGPTGFNACTAGSKATGGPWSVYGQNGGFSCVIYRHSLSSGHVLSVFPIQSTSEKKIYGVGVGGGATANSYQISGNAVATGDEALPFSRIYFSNEPTYKSSFLSNGANGTGVTGVSASIPVNAFISATASGTAYRESDFNVIEGSEKIVSFSNPDLKNGISFDYDDDSVVDTNAEIAYSAFSKSRRKKSSCVFQNYFVPARNGAVCAFEMNQSMSPGSGKKYCIKNNVLSTPTFKNPIGVLSYNNYLMFYNVRGLDGSRHFHRLFFSLAGMVDSFSATQFENLSDGEEILWIEEWFGSLIVFFSNKIRKYTGVPGNASLDIISTFGVSCAELICKTERGIFFLANNGIYLYNGTFNKIVDKSTYFDLANINDAVQDGWLEFNEGLEELYFYPGNSSFVNIWSAKNNTFRRKDYSAQSVTSGVRLFKYYHNNDSKTAISYPGITHISEVETGTTYKAVTSLSGDIDVDPSHEQKRFDRCSIEFVGQSSAGTVAQVDTLTGTTTGGGIAVVHINGLSIDWAIASTPNMAEEFEELFLHINITYATEPVAASYINLADHSAGLYITATTPGVPFSLSIDNIYGATGTIDRAAYTANAYSGMFSVTLTFDDGATVSESNISLESDLDYVTKHIMISKQAKLVNYQITAPAQTAQLIITSIKFWYTPVMTR